MYYFLWSKIEFDSDNDIHVFFTLYEKSDYYGNIPVTPVDDLKSDGILRFFTRKLSILFNRFYFFFIKDAKSALTSAFNGNEIKFGFYSPFDNKV